MRGSGASAAPLRDPHGGQLASLAAGPNPAAMIVGELDPELVDDRELVAAVRNCADQLAERSVRR
jgi:hypothetical protein